MPGPVATVGTMTTCDFGLFPSVFIPLPLGVNANFLPVGCIEDIIPIVNIVPFGMCDSELKPMVIALTAAALGVPTPAPCIPVVVDPWVAPSDILIDGVPVLTEGAFCECLWGGTIDLVGPSPGFNVLVE